MESGGHSPCANGLQRLLADLAEDDDSVALPVDIRDALFAHIAAEPARVETDAHGFITAINPAFSQLCGYSFAEVRGLKPGSFLQGSATDTRAVEALREGIRLRVPVSAEMVNYHKNGSAYRVHISIRPVLDAEDSLVGFRAIEHKLPLEG